MHLAKGLEFRAVAVMACDDEIIPPQVRIENVADDANLEEVYASATCSTSRAPAPAIICW
jgi:superfamily I DNA/RNA helicase